jgi:hypothetical protein
MDAIEKLENHKKSIMKHGLVIWPLSIGKCVVYYYQPLLVLVTLSTILQYYINALLTG